MINTKKQINATILQSEDLFKDMFVPINKRQGFIRSKSPNIPIYFYRYIGIWENKEVYYDDLDKLNTKLTSLNDLYLNFNSCIPIKILSTAITEVPWNGFLSTSPLKRNALISIIRNKGLLPNLKDNFYNDYIENALDKTLELYLANEPTITETVIKNFAIKFLGWISEFAPKLFHNTNYNYDKDIINPKVLFYGEIKKHEMYFLIFLSKLGCDVLYVNSLSDIDFQKIDKDNKYSKLIKLPKTEPLLATNFKTDTNYKKVNKEVIIEVKKNITPNKSNIIKDTNSTSSIVFKDSISIILKSSMNIFNDLMLPVNKRIGFISGTIPFIPVYFYRYVGIEKDENNYYNDLFKLDKNFNILDSLYLKFTDSIPMISNPKLITNTLNIWQYIDPFEISLTNKLATLLMEYKIFSTNSTLNCSMANSFSYILDIYCKEEENLNLSKVRNFTLKLLSWVHNFVPNLMKDFDFQNKSSDEIFNPKVIYYGNIKKHELLFLVFLSRLGCDVLYINSHCDMVSEVTENSDLFSKSFELPYKAPLKEFPKEELLIRQETIALKASKELSTALYTDDDGFYKPWQFEEYKTIPITLKTTYYELKILWNEPSSLRTGFIVENYTVHIPNLFAKISGVHSDLNLYWKDISLLKSSENTLFIREIPFTNVTYTKTDLYSLAFVLDNNGLVDKQKLHNHSSYKFTYLKTSLQQIILDKINYLIKTDMLIKTIDKELKLKILMTILDIDKNILQLIQQYDYPSKIPKLIIYDNNESAFSDEDSITLCFLNLFGFDITILTPTGYNNIEEKIQSRFYDTHRLEEVNFNLPLPNLSEEKKYTKAKVKIFFSNVFNLK